MDRATNQRNLRRLGYASLVLTAVFIIATVICSIVSAGQLEIMLPEENSAEMFRPESDIVQVRADPNNERRLIVTADRKGGKRGKVFIKNEAPNVGEITGYSFEYVNVLPGGVIYNMTNGNFSGYRGVTLIVQIYVVLITGLLIINFTLRCRTELYSYSTLFSGGAALFLTSILINMLLANGKDFTMMYIYSMLKNAGSVLVTLCFPLMAVFAVSLAVSNIVLIKKEGRSFVNLLGLIMSVLIICGYAFKVFLDLRFISGSEREMRIAGAATSVYYTTFGYFEMMLISASACGILAAKKKPSFDKTHIIILGCAIADDGTPLPLLRGRIDRAIAFSKEQKAQNGKAAIFVPSGGQGSDEIIAEAESMRNYLLAQGVDESSIILENKSTDTQENMRFSLEKIKADCNEPRIVFSTSGYHVLRSGMISESEGLNADGIGCKTKWYFWPNAFIREFIGLLAEKWKKHAFWILFFIVLFTVINMIIPM